MIERGIPKPPDSALWFLDDGLGESAWRWIVQVWSNYPRVRTYEPTLNPTSVSANSESVQTFTVTGLAVTDIVTVNKPSDTASLGIVQAWVSAANTLSIKFRNFSGGAIDPPSEAYRILAVRI